MTDKRMEDRSAGAVPEEWVSQADASGCNRRAFLRQAGTLAGMTAAWAMGAAPVAGAQEAGANAGAGGTPVVRVAMLSKWHVHAEGYAKTLSGMPDVQITAVWDEEPERGKAWAEAMGVPFEPDLAKVLQREDVDAVAVDAPTNRHAEVMVAAANAGKHIFTEKVMAPTVAECERIAEAVRTADVKFAISFPYRTRPEVLYAHKALEDGLLGQLTFIRVRVAHDGGSAGWLPPHFWDPVPTGGGAMMDLGAHPMYLSRWFGGQPKRISSTFNFITGHEVEDNAVAVIEFENKCIGVAETSFVSTFSPFSLELSGTEGSLVVGGPDEKQIQIRSKKIEGQKWTTPELPEPSPNPLRLWIDAITKGTPIPFSVEEGIQLTELMQYAYQSHREGKQVEIPKRA